MHRGRIARFSICGLILLSPLHAAAAPAADNPAVQIVRDLALVDAITWGVNPSTMAAYHTLGREKWLQTQLHPASDALPATVQTQIEALPVSQKSCSSNKAPRSPASSNRVPLSASSFLTASARSVAGFGAAPDVMVTGLIRRFPTGPVRTVA